MVQCRVLFSFSYRSVHHSKNDIIELDEREIIQLGGFVERIDKSLNRARKDKMIKTSTNKEEGQ